MVQIKSNQSPKDDRPSTVKVWVLAARPHTLTASIAPVLVGWAVVNYFYKCTQSETNTCYAPENFKDLDRIALMFGAFACLIQLGTNLHNDYADFIKGADTKERVGQARATQRGWLTPFETAAASTICLLIAAVLGMMLTGMTGRWNDPYMIFVTSTSVFNAVCYTGGPYPLGYIGLEHWSIAYSGLGDLFVFLYFGLVATVTVPYVVLSKDGDMTTLNIFQHELFWTTFIVAIPVGFLATGIIVVNNLRDRLTDVGVGKNTLAVKFGETFTRIEYLVLVVGSYFMLVPVSMMAGFNANGSKMNYALLLPIISLLPARKALKVMGFGSGKKDGASLNPYVGGTAKVQLIYCLLFMVGLKLS
jgi:1,4-dihydroxy-2-naphthoate octaprenyltransferase